MVGSFIFLSPCIRKKLRVAGSVDCYAKVSKYTKRREKSLKLEENAWALHGLACLSIQGGNENLAALYVQRGMELQRDCLSYQKEGLKILGQCEAYGAILQQYAALDEQMKSIGRVQYYYVLGLVKTGQRKTALSL